MESKVRPLVTRPGTSLGNFQRAQRCAPLLGACQPPSPFDMSTQSPPSCLLPVEKSRGVSLAQSPSQELTPPLPLSPQRKMQASCSHHGSQGPTAQAGSARTLQAANGAASPRISFQPHLQDPQVMAVRVMMHSIPVSGPHLEPQFPPL